MPIQKGDFIRLTYTGSCEGSIFDSTDEETAKKEGIFRDEAVYGPVTICVGCGHVITGLDESLEGKEVGEEGTVEVPPEKGFGQRNDSDVRSYAISKFNEKPQQGMRVQIEGREGIVVNVVGKRAVVDFNHLYAGRELEYTYKIEGAVEKDGEKIKGLLSLYTGRDDFEVKMRKGVADVVLPAGIMYDKRWLLFRSRVIYDIFEYIDTITEVLLKESFKRPAGPGETKEGAPVEEAEEKEE